MEEDIMLKIAKNVDGEKLTVALEGRLDTTTAPQLNDELKSALDGITELVIDAETLEYISSAGLRVLLSAQKSMAKKGSMVVKNVSEEVQEILEVTGFIDILTVQ